MGKVIKWVEKNILGLPSRTKKVDYHDSYLKVTMRLGGVHIETRISEADLDCSVDDEDYVLLNCKNIYKNLKKKRKYLNSR
jgi:hypothetical protein